MPRLLSPLAEGLALRGLCGRSKEVKGILMASLNESFFRTDAGKESYNYIMHSLNQRGVTPAFSLMLETAKLSGPTKEFLKDCENSPKTADHAHQIISNLNDYRRAFLFYENARAILTELENKKMDLDGLTATTIDTLTAVQTGRDSADSVYHFGTENTSDEIVKRVIHEEDSGQVIPTGYKAWDDVNGGLPRGSLVILAGSTGAGKSHNALQLGVNVAEAGYKAAVAPLEMSAEAMTGRWLANVSGIDSLKILLKQLATDEKTFIEEKAAKWNRRVEKRGGRFTIHKPGSDVTIEALLAEMHSYNADVIIIDYISLLAGADGDDQWRKLGAIARYAARYADVHNKVVILLAQVDEQDKIRYAKSIKEHAAIMWSFVATKETKEQGILKYNVQKARIQDSRGFSMHIDYSTSRIKDFTAQEDQRTATQTADGSTRKSHARSMKDNAAVAEDDGMMPDLTEDVE